MITSLFHQVSLNVSLLHGQRDYFISIKKCFLKFPQKKGKMTADRQIDKIGTARRLTPQVGIEKIYKYSNNTFNNPLFLLIQIIVATIKNLIILNKTLFDGSSVIIIPALSGIAVAQNPYETIHIEASQASWLCKLFKIRTKRDQFKFEINIIISYSSHLHLYWPSIR